jgi:hypothetical protein
MSRSGERDDVQTVEALQVHSTEEDVNVDLLQFSEPTQERRHYVCVHYYRAALWTPVENLIRNGKKGSL